MVGPPDDVLELELDDELVDAEEPVDALDDAEEPDEDFESLLHATNSSSATRHHNRFVIGSIVGGGSSRT